MADVQGYLAYQLRWEDRRGDGKVEGYAPFDAIIAAGGVWEGGVSLDPLDPDLGWYGGYLLDSSTLSTDDVVAACQAAGWTMIKGSAVQALSQIRTYYEAQVTKKNDITMGADGRADFSAVTWVDDLTGASSGASAPATARMHLSPPSLEERALPEAPPVPTSRLILIGVAIGASTLAALALVAVTVVSTLAVVAVAATAGMALAYVPLLIQLMAMGAL